MQISYSDWYADYPAASDFLNVLFACAAFHPGSDASINIAGVCDPALDAMMNHAMDAAAAGGSFARPMGLTIMGFFLRIGLTVGVLYVSLKYLNGTAFALLAGIGLGLFSLMVEALRLLKRWTV